MSANDLAIIEAVIGHLEDWARWQKGYRIRLGYSPKSAGFETGGTVSEESGNDYSNVDQTRYEMIDACVDDLAKINPAQAAAIMHRYMATVFRMRDYPGSLALAHEWLYSAFRRKGVMF